MKTILLRMGELFLKGENRSFFENALVNNIKLKLSGLKYKLEKTRGRLLITEFDDCDELVCRLKKVFGLYSLSIADELLAEVDEILNYFKKIDVYNKTFKIDVNRADKTFPINSMEMAARIGEVVLKQNAKARVELYKPDLLFCVDIRSNGKAYVYHEVIKCQGGLPLSTSGKALLLLSGGIDSPVAGYMMAKRGLRLEAIHFHSYPYTSPEAKQKVLTLAKKLSEYIDESKVHCISFTKIQEEIHSKCAPEFMITLMRRIMMRISERVAKKNNLGAIITGESLGQVASQTMQSMTVTEQVVMDLPIFRPCVGLDKEDIIKIAKDIDTFETSILPYEDCCTVFLPKNPIIKPKISKVLNQEKMLDIESLVNEALEGEEIISIVNEN